MHRFFFTLYQGLIALFFLFLGLVALVLPWYVPMQDIVQNLIIEHPQSLLIIGIVLCVIGLGMILFLSMSNKKRTLVFVSGNLSTEIDTRLIDDLLKTYWNKLYPNEEILSRSEIKNDSIYIFAEIPESTEEEALIKQIEQELSAQFFTTLGYRNPIHFSITFNKAL